MNPAELFLGQIPEAIYFGLFLILTKRLKEKRILFVILMIIEYLLLKRSLIFNSWFQISYIIVTFITLKILYKNDAQITDVFTFGIASTLLIIISFINFLIFGPSMKIVVITSRMLLFIILYLLRNKLYKLNDLYKKLWNRNDLVKKKMKSTTFRALNLVLFNLMFYIINLGTISALIMKGR